MPNRIITAQVQGEYIKLSSATAGAAGSHNAVSLEISFDSLWDGTSRKVYFISADGAQNACVTLTTDLLKAGETDVYVVPMPSEGLASAGEMTLTIKGYHVTGTVTDRVVMSASVRMTVLRSDKPAADTEPADVTPAQAEQLQSEIDDIKTAISGAAAAATAAGNSAAAAAKSASDASASATAAAQSAAAAKLSETAAGNSESASASSAASADTARAAAQAAQSAAETAKTAAEAARDAAQTAKTASETAQGKAETAQSAAEIARTAAQNAQSLAETARAAAQGAATAAQSAQSAAETARGGAETAASNASGSADEAEAWACGTIGGTAVPSTHPAYNNNSKYYKDQAAAIVGGDYPTKTEAQGYVSTHNSASNAHSALFAAKLDTTGNASNVTNAFTQASSRANLATGEKQSVSLGKIMKWFADLGTAAFAAATAFAAAVHTHTKADITDFPASLKNPSALSFGSKSYDGSAAATVTAADLGAVTDISGKQDLITTSGILKGAGSGTVSAADAAALKSLLDKLSAVAPATGDKIPLTDISGAAAGYSTIADILALVTPGAQIATGSYTGTGTYGSSNPCSLTFDFIPKLVIVEGPNYAAISNYSGYGFLVISGFDYAFTRDNGNSSTSTYVKITWNAKTLSWYVDSLAQDAFAQCNYSNWIYRYVALG